MKTILFVCGAGVATSTVVCNKVKELLDSHGFEHNYQILQCSVAQASAQSQNADLVIATTAQPEGIACEFISGIPFLTGFGAEDVSQQILEFMKSEK